MESNILDRRPMMFKEKGGSELLWRKEDDKHILLARHDMYVLNEFSKEIMDICDGKKTVQDIVQHVKEKYEVDSEVVYTQVEKLLYFLLDKKLIYWEE